MHEPNMTPHTVDAYCRRVLATLVAQRVIGAPEMTADEAWVSLDFPPFDERKVAHFLNRLHADGLATSRQEYREFEGYLSVYAATDLGVRRILGAV